MFFYKQKRVGFHFYFHIPLWYPQLSEGISSFQNKDNLYSLPTFWDTLLSFSVIRNEEINGGIRNPNKLYILCVLLVWKKKKKCNSMKQIKELSLSYFKMCWKLQSSLLSFWEKKELTWIFWLSPLLRHMHHFWAIYAMYRTWKTLTL